MSARVLNAAAEEISASVAALITLASVEIVKPTLTRGTLQHLLATAGGLREDIRLLRVDLDREDVETSDLLDEGQNTLALWTWERALRASLVRSSGLLTKLEATLASLSDGDGRLVHVVRDGETLQMIAARYLGGWMEWWRLIEANGLADPILVAGQVLVIPEK